MNSNKTEAGSRIHPFLVVLFGLSITELILGGGGRWYDWGFLTPRMLLFAACQLTWLVGWARGAYQPGTRVLGLTLIPLMGMSVAAVVGLQNGAASSAVFTDLKPLLFILNLPFYAMILRNQAGRTWAGHLFRWLGLAMAVTYLIFWSVWQSEWIDGWAFYQSTASMDEFFFRGNMGFFYKGFIFLPIALFFWQTRQNKWKYGVQLVIYAAILLTFTRAIWLILLFFPLRALWDRKGRHRLAWVALILMLSGPWLVEKVVVDTRNEREFPELKGDAYPNQAYLEQYPYPTWQRTLSFAFGQGIANRQFSMMERFVQIDEVVQRIDPWSLFFGHGFGIGTPLKPVHMEISYLEIFHKQGIIGLFVWGLLLIAHGIQFRRSSVMNMVDRSLSIALLHSTFLMFSISFFNPFINSPMGLAVLAMGIALPHRFYPGDKSMNFSKSWIERPPVSVCMATFNGSRWIRAQIDSILPQLLPGDELCVADDGSTDGTLDILQEYCDQGAPIIVIPAEGQALRNPSYNLERALNVAKGEFIFLADQDDVWLPGKVDGVCRSLFRHTLVIHDAQVADEHLRTLSPSFFDLHQTKPGAIENFVRNHYLGCCMAFRKTLLQKALPFPPKLAMHDIWLGNVAALWHDTHFLTEKYVRYRRHSDAASTTAAPSGYSIWQQIQLRGQLALQLGQQLIGKS
jgi:hypothetical protein